MQRGTSPQNLLALVAAGVGITRLPLSSRSLRRGGVRFVPLADEDACVVLVWQAQAQAQNPALRAVLHEISRDIDLSG